jgi:hypothetical protein
VNVDTATQAALSTGQRFQLLEFGSSSGGFAEIGISEPAGPLTWATSRLLVDGRLQVISEVPGDADGNGRTDLSDFGVLKANFGAGGADWSLGDFDLDGSVGLGDFGVLKANFGQGGAAGVPEPATAWLAAAGGLSAVALRCSRRKRRSS